MPKHVVPRALRAAGFTTRVLVPVLVVAACAASYRAGVSHASHMPPQSLPSSTAAAAAAGFRTGSIGPWGQLELLHVEIEPPPALILNLKGDDAPLWSFPGYTPDRVLRLLQQEGVTPAVLASLPSDAWLTSPDGVALRVPLQFLLGLSSQAREAIYAVLAQARENFSYHEPLIIEQAHLDERLRTSGLSVDIQQTFRRLLYHSRGELVFADYSPMLAWLRDDAARLRFSAMVVRKDTLLVRLRIAPTFDLDGIVRYWDAGHRGEPMRPLLEALARLPGGADINIAYLLPAFASRHIFTYPDPSRPSDMMGDCFWSALNFFNDTPDGRFHDFEVIRQTLDREYRPVEGPAQFGDLVVLFAERDRMPVHAAVYLADGVVFTKTGGVLVQPWIFMEQAEMERHYTYWSGPLITRVLRRLP